MANIGIPIKLLHEAVGLIVTLEVKSGHTYRGKLQDVEDTMNVHMNEVSVTDRCGSVTLMDNVYLRGSQVTFILLPDNLKFAPYLSLKAPVTNPNFATSGMEQGAAGGGAGGMRGMGGRGRGPPGRPRGRARR